LGLTAPRHTILDEMQQPVSGKKRLQGPRCSATTKASNPCEALAGADGKCSAHCGRQDMRAIGSKGGKGRRRGIGERLPETERESLREALRGLDPETVKAAVEQALTGGNESARVGAVRLLADLEPFSRGCPECEARKAEAPDIEAKLIDLLGRHAAGNETERKAKIRTAVHEELAAVAEHVDVTQVEEQLVARL
jgi:hypothetical protein